LFGSRDVLALHGSVEAIDIVEVEQSRPRLGTIAPEHGRAALAAAEGAIRAAMDGGYAAVVGAPHTEAAIHAAGVPFDGYPSFVARITGVLAEESILMLCLHHDAREVFIAHVTLHTSVAQALTLITVERVLKTIRAAHAYLGGRPIAVSGVQPQASGRVVA